MPKLSPEAWSGDLAACIAMMRGGSKTFFAASRLLPPRVRAASIALYAFCRVADDLVDQGGDALANLAMLQQRLELIYAGTPADFVEDQALALVVQQYQLPRLFLEALVEGFEWDTQGRTYRNLEALQGYAARVAGTVGAMMCWIMGAHAPQTMARACELGVAMQLTNIARDVGEDARNGRLYLPLEWMERAGIDTTAWLQKPESSSALKSVVEELLAVADALYQRAEEGIAELPLDCRGAILAASSIYAEIGHQLRKDGLDSVQNRAVVSTSRKLLLLASAWAQARWIYANPVASEPLPAVRFLVEVCEVQTDRSAAKTCFPNRALPHRIEWVLGLFERLESDRRGRKSVSLTA